MQALCLQFFDPMTQRVMLLNPTPLEGTTQLSVTHWQTLKEFIELKSWFSETPALTEDSKDPIIQNRPHSGTFMMGFDFHLTPIGPKLIEINTNAGGFAALIETCPHPDKKQLMKDSFVRALKDEYTTFNLSTPLNHICILDDDIKNQWLYPEMVYFADLLTSYGFKVSLAVPHDLELKNNIVFYQGLRVDFIYNRVIDFRLSQPNHQVLRNIILNNAAAVSPQPAVYARSADKRLLLNNYHSVLPQACLLQDKTVDEWKLLRKRFVFKPLNSAASKGVYRGDHVSLKKLTELPPDTLAQELIPPPRASDGTKYDLRVFTSGTQILGIASRHFNGQVMEMRTPGSGIRWVEII